MNEMQTFADGSLAAVKKDLETQPLPTEQLFNEPVTRDNYHLAEQVILKGEKDWMYCIQTEAYAINAAVKELQKTVEGETSKIQAKYKSVTIDSKLNDPFHIHCLVIGQGENNHEYDPHQELRNITDAVTVYYRFVNDVNGVVRVQKNKAIDSYRSRELANGLVGLTEMEEVVKNPNFEQTMIVIRNAGKVFVGLYNPEHGVGAAQQMTDDRNIAALPDALAREFLSQTLKEIAIPDANGYIITNPSELVDSEAMLTQFKKTIVPELKKSYESRTWKTRFKRGIANFVEGYMSASKYFRSRTSE